MKKALSAIVRYGQGCGATPAKCNLTSKRVSVAPPPVNCDDVDVDDDMSTDKQGSAESFSAGEASTETDSGSGLGEARMSEWAGVVDDICRGDETIDESSSGAEPNTQQVTRERVELPEKASTRLDRTGTRIAKSTWNTVFQGRCEQELLGLRSIVTDEEVERSIVQSYTSVVAGTMCDWDKGSKLSTEVGGFVDLCLGIRFSLSTGQRKDEWKSARGAFR